MSIKKLLGARIRELRKERKFSQEYFSELIGINPRQIVRIENGECFPTAENLEKIASVFEIRAQEFFINNCYLSEDEMKSEIVKKLNFLTCEKLKALYLISVNI